MIEGHQHKITLRRRYEAAYTVEIDLSNKHPCSFALINQLAQIDRSGY